MKIIISFVFYLIFITSSYSSDISSTKIGGLWSNPKSWVGGIVPTAVDNVTIDGKIIVDEVFVCAEITILAKSFLVIDTKNEKESICQKLLLNGGLIIESKSIIRVKTYIEKDDNAIISNKGVIYVGI